MVGSAKIEHAPTSGFLDRAPENARQELLRSARAHDLVEGEILQDVGEPIKTIYLPASGIISLLAVSKEGLSVEAGLVGREGFAGISALLGRESPGNVRAMSQIEGKALEVDADVFGHAMETSEEFSNLAKGYINAVWAETAQSVACNRLHTVNQRCARWLLLVADRLGRSEFRLTQEFLAMMLGIRRPSVSVAAEQMQERGLISYQRGNLRVLDRDGLQDSSCECYSIIRAELDLAVPGALGPPL